MRNNIEVRAKSYSTCGIICLLCFKCTCLTPSDILEVHLNLLIIQISEKLDQLFK